MRIFLRLRFNLRVRFFFHLAVIVYSWKEREKLLRVSFSVAVVLPKGVRVLCWRRIGLKKNCENKISARARLIHRAEKKPRDASTELRSRASTSRETRVVSRQTFSRSRPEEGRDERAFTFLLSIFLPAQKKEGERKKKHSAPAFLK